VVFGSTYDELSVEFDETVKVLVECVVDVTVDVVDVSVVVVSSKL